MLTNHNGIGSASHPLSETLVLALKKEVLQGKLHQGEKLSEQKLCEQHGLSRTPVREALRQLEQEGLVKTIPNRGAFVVGLTSQDISDLYEMRKSYEILAVKWAIQRISKEELEKLGEAYEFMEFYTLRNEAEKMLNINMNFHEQIYRAAQNRMLFHILTNQQFYLMQTRVGISYLDGCLEEVLKEHKKIHEAFLEKDWKAGVAAVSAHLENAQKRAGKIS